MLCFWLSMVNNYTNVSQYRVRHCEIKEITSIMKFILNSVYVFISYYNIVFSKMYKNLLEDTKDVLCLEQLSENSVHFIIWSCFMKLCAWTNVQVLFCTYETILEKNQTVKNNTRPGEHIKTYVLCKVRKRT